MGSLSLPFRWNKMPKHIKISKHPDSRKFYVSDVCEFLSVEVCGWCVCVGASM